MTPQTERETIGLSELELTKILDQCDGAGNIRDIANRRRHIRCVYRTSRIPVEFMHAGGSITRSLCRSRNISANGISLIHSAFIHRGSKVHLVLTHADGNKEEREGIIVHCRHLGASAHEVGVSITQPIDPTLYVTEEKELAKIYAEQAKEIIDVKGVIVHLTGCQNDAMLIAHYLRGASADLQCIQTTGALFDNLRIGITDAVLLDIDSVEDDAEKIVKRLRENSSYTFRVVILTADSNLTEKCIKSWGADHIIHKPHVARTLRTILSDDFERDGKAVTNGGIQSTLPDEPGLSDLISSFVTNIERTSRQIEIAIELDDYSSARQLCLQLIGTGTSYGFGVLTEQATEALLQLNASCSVAESVNQLNIVRCVCDRLMDPRTSG